MSVVSLRLPDYLHQAVRKLALQERVTINQLITLAIAEKVSVLMAEDYIAERARRGNRAAFERVLAKAPNAEPEPYDRMGEFDRIQEEKGVYLVRRPSIVEDAAAKPSFEVVWQRILQHQNEEFRQRRGAAFTYTVQGDMLKPDRMETGIARSQFEQGYARAPFSKVTDVPKQLWGPSYIYAILMDERIRQSDW